MKIYNTLTEKKEDLASIIKGKKLRLFVCGPTVYDYSHIGHARTYIFFDLAASYLKSLGYKIFYLQNITDIDDKIINRSQSSGSRTPAKLAKQFEKEYYKDMKAVGVTSVNKYARASDHIKEIIRQIQTLVKKGYAYKTDSGVYFEVKKFSDYGKLSKQNLEELRAGWRIEPDPKKKDPMDFALWKFKKHDYDPSWPSLWGEGRPGWHIEDTAITEKYFGPQYDLHGGGVDLKFPHHESEIAQQEASSAKKPLVKIWMHTGFLLVKGEKMSKSLHNFIIIRNFLKNHFASSLRLIVLNHHYRSPLDYQEQTAIDAEKTLESLAKSLVKLKLIKSGNKNLKSGSTLDGIKIKNYEGEFRKAMDDDFNTPKALAAIFSLINELNKNFSNLNKKTAKIAEKWLTAKLKFFKLNLKNPKIPAKIQALIKKRELFRSNQQFVQSDGLRHQIEKLGYTIEDTLAGPLVWPK